MPVRFEEDTPNKLASKVRFEEEPGAVMEPEQSALYGAGQGLTFGYSDEILGALKAAKDRLGGGSYPDLYKARVAKEREDLAKAQEQNPKSYLAGNIAGSIPTMAIPGLGIAKGASLGTALGRAALQGGLMASGESTANPLESPEKLREFAADTTRGAATGAAMQGIFSGIGKGIEKLTPESLRQTAAERAVKATTGQNISALRKMTGTTLGSAGDVDKVERGLRKVGSDIANEGVLGAFDKVEDLAPKLAQSREKYGKLIGQVGTQIDEAVPQAVDAKKIANTMADYATSIPQTESGKRLQEKILAEAANFENMGKVTFEEAQKLKNQFKFKPQDADALISNQDATNKLRSIIGKEMDDTVEGLAAKGGELGDLIKNYKDYKGKYGSFKGASDAATDRVQKNLSNRFVSPSDYGVGATTGVLGALTDSQDKNDDSRMKYLLYGALGAMGNKFARERGSALASRAASEIANALEKSPDFAKKFGSLLIDAAKRGPAALTTTHAIMMKKPEYRTNFEESEQ
jgi:hypothetical protein